MAVEKDSDDPELATLRALQKLTMAVERIADVLEGMASVINKQGSRVIDVRVVDR